MYIHQEYSTRRSKNTHGVNYVQLFRHLAFHRKYTEGIQFIDGLKTWLSIIILSITMPKSKGNVELHNNILYRFEQIENDFKLLRFDKIKDLANVSLGKVYEIKSLGVDSMTELSNAIQIFDQSCRVEQLKDAKRKYDQDNFEETKKICHDLLIQKPNDVKVLILLSASYYCSGKCSESSKYLEMARKIDPNSIEVLLSLGIHFYTFGELKVASICLIEALKKDLHNINSKKLIQFSKLLTLTDSNHEAEFMYKIILYSLPDLYIVRNLYAKVLISLNKLEEAKIQYLLALKTEPQNADTLNNFGNLYDRMNKINDAIDCYKIALECDRTLPITWNNLGIQYSKLKEYQNAIDCFQNALELCPENTIDVLKNLGKVYFNQKEWLLFVDSYEKIWKLKPDDIDTNLWLGLVYFDQLNNYKEAEKYFKNLIKNNPLSDEFLMYVIAVYKKQGKTKSAYDVAISVGDMHNEQKNFEKAVKTYFWALQLEPENIFGHMKFGNVLYSQGCLEMALERYKYATSLKLDIPIAYYDCGRIYEEMNNLEKALEHYKIAYALDPDSSNYSNKMVFLQKKLGYFDDVANLLLKALKDKDPNDYDVNLELANILHQHLGKLDDALFYYNKAMKINNKNADVFINMGNLFLELEKKENALNCFNEAIKLNPECTIAHTNAGSIYKDCEKFTEAIHAYQIVLDINPDSPDAYCNFVQCSREICNWLDYDNRISKLKEIVFQQLNNNQVPSLLPRHSLLYSFTPEELKQIAVKHAEQSIKKALLARKVPQDYLLSTQLSKKRIRVGYVFSDFDDHSITLLMQSICQFHNKDKVKVFCFSLSKKNDDSPCWFKIISDKKVHFIDISSYNVVDAANRINYNGINILVDMNGYSKGARNEIFALRPAPIQVSWLGYPSTSGATFIDYLITDNICFLPELEQYYTEKLAYVNQSVFIGHHKQMYYDLGQSVLKSNLNNEIMNSENDCSRQKYNLPENVIVYYNFCRLYKIEPSTFRMWTNILKNVPNSVLWLLKLPFDGAQNLIKYAAFLNIDSSRIIFTNIVPKEEHIRRLQLADVFLDTPLFNSGHTCLDAIWAGTPIVTLPGNTFASRIAKSMLTTLGCEDTIAQDLNGYVIKATLLGTDKEYLKTIKSKICSLKMTSDLYNCKSYAENLENIYEDMWKKFSSDKH